MSRLALTYAEYVGGEGFDFLYLHEVDDDMMKAEKFQVLPQRRTYHSTFQNLASVNANLCLNHLHSDCFDKLKLDRDNKELN